MILTGSEIEKSVSSGDIVIEPFLSEYIDPNSYSFHLHEKIMEYTDPYVDPKKPTKYETKIIPKTGLVLMPNRFYLGATVEKMGSAKYASELYANLSTATSGMFIQTSAPLGHTGAIVNWTLEILVTQNLRVYPNMKIGKICFWKNFGESIQYRGRYLETHHVTESRILEDFS